MEVKFVVSATDVKGVDTEYDKEGELLTLGFANTSITVGIEWGTPSSKAISSRALRETGWLVGHNTKTDFAMNNSGTRIRIASVKQGWRSHVPGADPAAPSTLLGAPSLYCSLNKLLTRADIDV